MFGTNYEVYSQDYVEFVELMEESLKDTLMQESAESAALELEQIADDIEATYGESEEELIEALRNTACFNPLSETAIDLKLEAFKFLL